MAKFSGMLGYVTHEQTSPDSDVYKPTVVERPYRGDILKQSSKWESTDNSNDDFKLNIRISIIADQYANENIGKLRYVTYKGSKWKITKIDFEYPRQILTVGGLYNG